MASKTQYNIGTFILLLRYACSLQYQTKVKDIHTNAADIFCVYYFYVLLFTCSIKDSVIISNGKELYRVIKI